MRADQVRRTFLDFFKARGHAEVASSSLVPSNDPSLLFTNAGMVQFKDVFTGKETRDYVRATTSQKCVRAGGKHNDLESVGVTPRHHTFFEMLGNFSFGDYFKKDAIEYAWELTTKVFGLAPERLAVTVFKGEDGIPADEEAEELWRSVGVRPERILRLGKKDNYWQMGDTGPQGPCSEIHYFQASDVENMLAPGRVEHSRGWLEIWNCVFMQFVRETKDGPLDKLPKPSVDTGAGLERFTMVLQGKKSNYETDLFTPLLEGIAAEVRKPYAGGDTPDEVSMRVIADHSRAAAFLIADGVTPSSDERGYVLRRIMRRAIRHGQKLGLEDLFFHRACLRVVERMEAQYPDLRRAADTISKVAETEETMFRRTLVRGLRLLNNEMERARSKGRTALEPKFVGELYGTYGFPIDLTRVIANENGFQVDEDAAKVALAEGQGGGAEGPIVRNEKAVDKVWFTLRSELGATEFTGYATDAGAASVRAIVRGGERVTSAGGGEPVDVVLDRTPFYGESGGQIGDIGELTWPGGRMVVENATRPLPEIVVHHGKIVEGSLAAGVGVQASVRADLRDRTRQNHSATHLLHLALKEVLGAHVQQKGSLVAPDRLRFDYAHFEPLTAEQMEKIETRVNAIVLANAATETVEGSIEDAKKAGAVMLFGEKYGDSVRMVRIGKESLELCGGTHVRRSGDIGLFKIVSDVAIASGVRRLEAVTGMNAVEVVQRQDRLLRSAAGVLRAAPEEVPDRIEKLVKKTRDLEKELERAKAEAAMGGSSSGADPLSRAEELAGVKVLVHRADGTPKGALRELADRLRDKMQSGVVVLAAAEEGKVSLLVAVTKDLAGKRVHAGEVMKAMAAAMGGSGGGKPDFAQGGGPAEKLEAGLETARQVIRG